MKPFRLLPYGVMGLGAVGAIVLVVEEPVTGGSWAMPTAQAVAAAPSSRVSPSRPYRASILIAGGGNQ